MSFLLATWQLSSPHWVFINSKECLQLDFNPIHSWARPLSSITDSTL